MSLDSTLKSRLAAVVTSRSLLNGRRRLHELRRRIRNADHDVHYFHDTADPYSSLTAQILQRFQDRFDIRLRPHLISGPPLDAIPDPLAHGHNAQKDAMRVAQQLGLQVPQIPDRQAVTRANGLLAACLGAKDFSVRLRKISAALWSGGPLPSGESVTPTQVMARGDQTLAKLGHYLGATFYYGGEWYWGTDRLHYLEHRLQQLGLGADGASILPPPDLPMNLQKAPQKELEFFFSFRSPYSYLAFDRVQRLARRHGAKLSLRPVLPMLMRGLPVPRVKSRYILRDCAREARRLGIPFGRICDPLGTGVERGYALFDYADSQGRLAAYCSTFMRSVWSAGVDAATDKGLSRIVAESGLDWRVAQPLLSNTDWRDRVETNQNRLQDIGLWGVPSFRVGGESVWGQDRLWAVSNLLRD
ncbi:hypothetical protein RA27_05885 [Ruegeria sp. ANG-R]|uniref:DsbA family protein n=1 Tax=Ruegeria sp. ANG-R TaxID=1577903 RepID=UPI00057D9565|nr:DsbA family protein [Ruegeria sp. ANG-R]KIC42857.1 hypothetical protein RA27_05885 [Ruegeria sp. ANG-R]